MKEFLLKIASAVEGFLLPFGAWGLMAIAFVDSAFLPLPHAIDLWVIRLCIRNPEAMLLYAGVATMGSVAGCLILYYVARRGGHAAAERKIGKQRMSRIRNWFEKYEFLTIMVPAILPPPTPFKAFIITAGVVKVQVGKFLLALFIGRAIRYFSEAFLAVNYGLAVWHFLTGTGSFLVVVLASSAIVAWVVIKVAARLRRVASPEGQ